MDFRVLPGAHPLRICGQGMERTSWVESGRCHWSETNHKTHLASFHYSFHFLNCTFAFIQGLEFIMIQKVIVPIEWPM